MPDATTFSRARSFLLREGRLLERRLMATLFEGEDAAGALDALAAYRNEDGGFGQALEPDTRVPASQPLHVETALGVMEAVGRVETAQVLAACGFLASLGAGVGCLTPPAFEYPLAPHWGDWAVAPNLNPTAGLVAHLWRWEVEHPWREAATAFCWEELDRGAVQDAHGASEAAAFLDVVPDRARAEPCIRRLADALPRLALFKTDPTSTEYGLTPLHFATSPTSRWARLFGPDLLDAHLDALAGAQAEDGGWTISWETTGPAAVQEWRGMETLRALRTLAAYGRLG